MKLNDLLLIDGIERHYNYEMIGSIIDHIHNKFHSNEVKNVVSHYSGGGVYHMFFHLDNGKIITHTSDGIQSIYISYKKYKSINNYISDTENGFGWEHEKPNWEERTWNIEKLFKLKKG